MEDRIPVHVIASGSSGNAVLLDNRILIDCGVPFKTLEPFAKVIQLVLLTHQHLDHYKESTIRRLSKERPALRFVCCGWMLPKLIEAHVNPARIDVIKKENVWYAYQNFGIRIKQQNTLHDVPNCCWHIEIDGKKKAFYATDMSTLEGIRAENYDLYLVEANRDEDDLEDAIRKKEKSGEFSYERRVRGTHLLTGQAMDFLYGNMGPESKYILLHQHKTV